jgi:hypothetical protein
MMEENTKQPTGPLRRPDADTTTGTRQAKARYGFPRRPSSPPGLRASHTGLGTLESGRFVSFSFSNRPICESASSVEIGGGSICEMD